MMSSAIYARIDPANPAAFSPTVLTDLLRGRLGVRRRRSSPTTSATPPPSRRTAPAERAVRFLAAGGTLRAHRRARRSCRRWCDAVLARSAADPAFAATVDAAVRTALLAKAGRGCCRPADRPRRRVPPRAATRGGGRGPAQYQPVGLRVRPGAAGRAVAAVDVDQPGVDLPVAVGGLGDPGARPRWSRGTAGSRTRCCWGSARSGSSRSPCPTGSRRQENWPPRRPCSARSPGRSRCAAGGPPAAAAGRGGWRPRACAALRRPAACCGGLRRLRRPWRPARRPGRPRRRRAVLLGLVGGGLGRRGGGLLGVALAAARRPAAPAARTASAVGAAETPSCSAMLTDCSCGVGVGGGLAGGEHVDHQGAGGGDGQVQAPDGASAGGRAAVRGPGACTVAAASSVVGVRACGCDVVRSVHERLMLRGSRRSSVRARGGGAAAADGREAAAGVGARRDPVSAGVAGARATWSRIDCLLRARCARGRAMRRLSVSSVGRLPS